MEDAHEDAAGDASSADGSGDWEQEQQEEGEGCGLGEECGLADAFEQFEARAGKRTQELLIATDQKLFEVKQTDATRDSERSEDSEPMADNVPSYIYMSDHFRLTKPPQFQFWQSNFPYLEVAGSALILDESTEHIQCIPMETSDPNPVAEEGNHDHGVLRVDGRACLQEPSQETQALYEEIILCDGFMEETLAEHTDEDEETDDGCFTDAVSPGAARFDEVVDSLTMECFSSTVVPLLTSFYKAMLQKQQRAVQSAREEVEAALIREAEEQIALQQARRLQLEQEVREEVARIEALEKANQPEERREAERRELLLKQQLAESEAEEEKVKTLAYTHTREWYQPNKKCFSHRGRQLTYLKPVLQAKEVEEFAPSTDHPQSPPINSIQQRVSRSKPRKASVSVPQRPQAEWVTGGALTNDRLCNISWVKKISRPLSSPSSPHRANGSRQPREPGNQKDSSRVQLPLLANAGAKPSAGPSSPPPADAAQKRTSTTSKPAPTGPKEFSTSPYHVPPRVLVEGDRQKGSGQLNKAAK